MVGEELLLFCYLFKFSCRLDLIRPQKAMKVPTVKGSNGFEMPLVGFGTWQAEEGELEKALEAALQAGYRHFDTAYAYGNEGVLGTVLNKWIKSGRVKRENLFIVTKLPVVGIRPAHVQKFLDLSLNELQLDYIDLYLMHVPFGLNYHDDKNIFPMKPDGTPDFDFDTDIIGTWKKMEEQVEAGKTRYIGVSNFSQEQLSRIMKEGSIPPANNQIQLHGYLQQPNFVKWMQDNGIVVTSYSTLGSGGTPQWLDSLGFHGVEQPSLLKNEVVQAVAEEIGKSTAQVLLRHMMQKNIVVIPKSVNPERVRQNFQLFDFELNDDQMERLNALDQDMYLIDFRTFLPGIENHPEYPFKH